MTSVADAWAQAYGQPTLAQKTSLWGGFDPTQQGSLSPDILGMMKNTNMLQSPDGRWQVSPNGDPGGGYNIYDLQNGGPGKPYYNYDSSGKFLNTQAGSKVQSYLSGILSVAGAGLGFSALGAGAGAAAGGAGDAGGFVGEGAASGVPAWDGALAGASTGTIPAAASTGGLSSMFSGGGGTNSILTRLGLTGLSSALGGGGSRSGNGGNMDLGSLISGLAPLLGGVSSAVNQGQASKDMISWLNGQQQRIDNTFAPGSTEFNGLWDQMSRMDAAAGRNSQYGPRSVDLATKLAQMKMDANTRLAGAFAKPYSDALNQNAGRFAGLTSALGAGGQNGSLAQLINALTGNPSMAGGSPPNPFYSDPWANTGSSLNSPFDYGNTGDLSSGNYTDSLGSTNYFDPTGWGGGTGGASYGNIDVSKWF